MQYRVGTVEVTQGSPIVVGTGTLFSTNIKAGDLFKLLTDSIAYTILSVESDTQFTLETSYVGTSYPTRQYSISRDRTPNLGLVEISAYDVDKEFLLTNEVIRKLDATPLHRITEDDTGVPLWDGAPWSASFDGGNARSTFDPLADIEIGGGNARSGLF